MWPVTTDLNPVEHQFVPQAIVTYNAAAELRLLSPHGIVKQSPPQRRRHRTQDLYSDIRMKPGLKHNPPRVMSSKCLAKGNGWVYPLTLS